MRRFLQPEKKDSGMARSRIAPDDPARSESVIALEQEVPR